MDPLKLAVFASGRGSNFLAILDAIDAGRLSAEVEVVISNNPQAGALDIARERSIPAVVINKKMFAQREAFVQSMLATLKKHEVTLVVLAGYMKKIPPEIILQYKNRVLNIHPALLPSFGGKGMYGHHVHEAVLAQGCRISGVTVHLVDEVYDRGPIVAQRCVSVEEGDTPGTLAARVLKTEHQIYAETLQLFAEGRVEVKEGKVGIKRK
ncbi:phosphoribosylglycinamide formyltransferase [bacterium]|nr:phosphoribosylglycinamide formyltransferase [bacterium]